MSMRIMCGNDFVKNRQELQSLIDASIKNIEEAVEFCFDPKKVEYFGFDLESFIRSILTKGKRAGKPTTLIKKEATSLALIGAIRRNNLENIKTKSHPEVVTFEPAFSVDVARTIKKYNIRPVVNLPLEIDNFPGLMCYSSFGSLIPTGIQDYELIKTAYLYHQIRLDKVLNSKNKNYRPDISKIENFLQISIDTIHYPLDKRIIILNQLGLINKNGTVVDTIAAMKMGNIKSSLMGSTY
ncbi:hypothetical protein RUM43_006518 [Polyplax serrata]|uniref:Uncharacterized protein n=1 Tax=Polyplax serrata TaxID=468196 RepID=A0AAN8NXX3_POLSC